MTFSIILAYGIFIITTVLLFIATVGFMFETFFESPSQRAFRELSEGKTVWALGPLLLIFLSWAGSGVFLFG